MDCCRQNYLRTNDFFSLLVSVLHTTSICLKRWCKFGWFRFHNRLSYRLIPVVLSSCVRLGHGCAQTAPPCGGDLSALVLFERCSDAPRPPSKRGPHQAGSLHANGWADRANWYGAAAELCSDEREAGGTLESRFSTRFALLQGQNPHQGQSNLQCAPKDA